MLKALSHLLKSANTLQWHVLDGSDRFATVRRGGIGDEMEIGGDANWRLVCSGEQALLISQAGGSVVCLNGSWQPAGGTYKLEAGGDYSVLIPRGSACLPFLVSGGSRPPHWASNGSVPKWLLKRGDRATEGPFETLEDLKARVAPGTAPPDATLWPEGGTAAFSLGDLWPDRVVPDSETDENSEGGADEWRDADISGDLLCIYCRHSFDEGHYLYLSPPNSRAFKDPAALPASWDLNTGHSYDWDKKRCEWRTCPHCQLRLPKSFGRGEYITFSLAGRARAGKSYFLAAMFKKAPKELARFNLSFIPEDAELNRDFEELKDVPFKQDPPENRYIRKTDNSVATQEKVILRGESNPRFVPKPIIYTLGSANPGIEPKHLVFYDNPGEHFTAVGRGDAMAEEARIAASHLAISSAIFISYDPTVSVGFQNALRLPLSGEGDLQLTMLSHIRERMRELQRATGEDDENDIPIGVLVMKWDIWSRLAPDLSRDCITPDHRLDLDAIRRNSDQVKALLDKQETGVPAAINEISRKALYFPVSAFGDVGVKSVKVGGVAVQVPAKPVEPRLAEIPFLWALSRSNRSNRSKSSEVLIPTVGDDGLGSIPHASTRKS